MQRYNDVLSFRDISAEILDLHDIRIPRFSCERNRNTYLVCIMIRRGDLHRRRQIENDPLILSRTSLSPSRLDSLTNRQSKLGFRLRESLGTIFVLELRPVFCCAFVCQLTDNFGVLDSEGDGFFLIVSEDDVTEAGASSVVHVDDGFLCACNRLDRALDQVFSSWCKDLRPSFFQYMIHKRKREDHEKGL